ncbi:MAG: RHS repeat-associated core domain-containing protein [Bacteroidales bacterium]
MGGSESEQRYTAWGSSRYTSGAAPTKEKYTGQLEAEAGLYFYNARWYAPYLNRFLSPDSIIPDPYNPLDWDRYAYVRNSPTNFRDSSGHCIDGVSTIVCAMVIGAAISVAVDAYVTTQINHEE